MSEAITARSTRPRADEHAPYYAAYVARVPDGDVVESLERQGQETLAMLRALPEGSGAHRYAEGKWTVREVLGHMCDTERVFAYRLMRFARNDETDLPGFDENLFVANGSFEQRTLGSLCDEFAAVRAATLHLLRSLTAAEWERGGTANRARATVRAIAWITAGHERHHVAILRERYL